MTNDDVERAARYLEGAAPGSMESDRYAARLIRRLRDERDKARGKALDEAAEIALSVSDSIGAIIADKIIALKAPEEPKPATIGHIDNGKTALVEAVAALEQPLPPGCPICGFHHSPDVVCIR